VRALLQNAVRTTELKKPEEGTMNNETDTIGGYAVPMDPMDLLQCDSCQ
jgi:hypothetical protein